MLLRSGLQTVGEADEAESSGMDNLSIRAESARVESSQAESTRAELGSPHTSRFVEERSIDNFRPRNTDTSLLHLVSLPQVLPVLSLLLKVVLQVLDHLSRNLHNLVSSSTNLFQVLMGILYFFPP
jgi:hypothetical protein